MARSKKDRSHFEPLVKLKGGSTAPRCQAWKSDGSAQCGKAATKGFNTCPTHGGNPRSGSHIVTGKHSKFIPKLDKAIAELMEDPELTGLRKEIAVIRFRQAETFDKLRIAVDQGLSHEAIDKEWDDLAKKATELTVAENKRQAQLASNMNARQANVLRAVLIAVLQDVVRDESIPRSQIPKVVGLKLIQKMS